MYIRCNNLLVGYNGAPVTGKLSFEIKEGDYLCVVGMNGAGKSTLMKTLLSLQEPIGGEISLGEGLKRFEIGYLPQQSDHQKDFPATVWEVVLSGTIGMHRGFFYKKDQKNLAMAKLQELGIAHLKGKSYRSLSGGQQQRVLLARALCATQKILLLDEPVTGLDPRAMQQLYRILDELHQKGITVIMITHDLNAISHATHVLHLDARKPFFGTQDAYYQSKQWRLFQEWEQGEASAC